MLDSPRETDNTVLRLKCSISQIEQRDSGQGLYKVERQYQSYGFKL